jgi:hypothetical protein
MEVSLFGADRVVRVAHALAHLVEQAFRAQRREETSDRVADCRRGEDATLFRASWYSMGMQPVRLHPLSASASGGMSAAELGGRMPAQPGAFATDITLGRE